ALLTPIIEQFDDVLMKDFLSTFFDWPRVQDIMNTFQCGMFGSPDWMTSTAELMRTVLGVLEYYEAGMDPFELAGFPAGGLISIPATMCEGIVEKGGEVRTGTNVKRIVIENGKAVGVELDDGEILKAPVVISNGGIKETVADLVGREHFDDEYADWIKDLKTGTSGFCLRAALDAPVTDVDMGGILLVEPGEMSEYFRELWQDFTIPDAPPPIYFSVPSNMDPSLAPPGKQLIVGIGCLMFDSKEPYSKMEKLALEGFRRAFPGFDEHYLWHDFLDPDTYIALGERLAPAIGLAQCVGQVGKYRPSSISPVEGLYYVGGEAGQNISGMACDMCVKSGLAAGKHIVSNVAVSMKT
ncbi:MAG: NAD(P)/FAD-dependent oxidoreductase, partial [Actinobacteria bacterium]|nr:NAD(P)/FAD-dependent oxidoreductase [Actinomycetota bacterium]